MKFLAKRFKETRFYSKFTVPLSQIRYKDHEKYGLQNSILAETRYMFGNVPNGFIIENEAIKYFLEYNQIWKFISTLEDNLNTENIRDFLDRIHLIYFKIQQAKMPPDLIVDILKAYGELIGDDDQKVFVQHSNFKHDIEYLVESKDLLMKIIKKCISDYYLDDAVIYRETLGMGGFNHKMNVFVQKFVDAKGACSGEIATRDPNYDSPNIFYVNASLNNDVDDFQTRNEPKEEWNLFRSTLKTHVPIIRKELIDSNRPQFILQDDQVLILSNLVVNIQEHFQKKLDFKMTWKRNPKNGTFQFTKIIPVQPVVQPTKTCSYTYQLKNQGERLLSGQSVGYQIMHGKISVMRTPKEESLPRSIIFTDSVDWRWDHVIRNASGLVLTSGNILGFGPTLCRELGIPCIVSARMDQRVNHGETVTMDCSHRIGSLYKGNLDYIIHENTCITKEPKLPFKVLISIDTPEDYRNFVQFPCNGIDISLDYIIEEIGFHPLTFLYPEKLKSERQEELKVLSRGFWSGYEWYCQKIASQIAQVCAVHPEKIVVVRLDQLTTDDYLFLKNGNMFENQGQISGSSRLIQNFVKDDKRRPFLEIYQQVFAILHNKLGIYNFHVELTGIGSVETAKDLLDVIMKEKCDTQFTFELKSSNIGQLDDLINIFDGITLNLEKILFQMNGKDDFEFDQKVADLVAQIVSKCKKSNKKCTIYMLDLNTEWIEFLKSLEISSVVVPPEMEAKLLEEYQK